MIDRTLQQIADATGGRATGDPDIVVDAVTMDSREVAGLVAAGLRPLFVARRGEHADGHDHAPSAVADGAVAVLGEHEVVAHGGRVPTVVVADTDTALAAFGGHVRDVVDPIVIGVTGSVGKTTTKDLLRSALGASRKVVAAKGSFNNDVGVPLTLLSLSADTEVLVVELGARGPGQIASLCTHVRPDVGIVTAVAGAHLELFGDLDGVAHAKAELPAAVGAEGTIVLNLDDPRVTAMDAVSPAAVLRCSAVGAVGADLAVADLRLDARARARFTAVTPWGDHAVELPVAGAHHAANALFALAATGAVGADVAAGAAALATAEVSPWRGAVDEIGGVVVIDDAYNANPTSVLAALDTLGHLDVPGKRVAVLGVMAEIGADHEYEHWRVGKRAASMVDHLVVVGEPAHAIAAGAREGGLGRVTVADDADDALSHLDLRDGDALLVKASRVAGLERVVVRLRADHTSLPSEDNG